MASILTIDDDERVRELLSRGLSSKGHKVIAAANGKDGFTKACTRAIDIILLDISMPEMSGLEVLRKLKSASRTSHLPVVMLTGHDDPELIDQSYFDYAEDYILKSVPLGEIEKKITRIVQNQPKRERGIQDRFRW